MDVFQAFPNALEEWIIAPCGFSTVIGNAINPQEAQFIHVIVDEGSNTDPNPSPSAQGAYSDTLIYCRPEEMPTLDTAELTASYIVSDIQTKKTYAIVDAGIGKNQHTGKIEHIELKLRQTGTEFDGSSS